MHVQLIGQRTRGPDAFFLRRYPGEDGNQTGDEVRAVCVVAASSPGEFEYGRQEAISLRQMDFFVIGVDEIERRCQVTRHGTPPRRNVWLRYPETLFDEPDHRGVIKHLGNDIASLAPRR